MRAHPTVKDHLADARSKIGATTTASTSGSLLLGYQSRPTRQVRIRGHFGRHHEQ